MVGNPDRFQLVFFLLDAREDRIDATTRSFVARHLDGKTDFRADREPIVRTRDIFEEELAGVKQLDLPSYVVEEIDQLEEWVEQSDAAYVGFQLRDQSTMI